VRDSNSGKLGVSIQGYLARRRGELKKNASIIDGWRALLPGHLHEVCSVESISGGVLRVAVEPGPYMHELSMLSDELLQRLEQLYPQACVRKIKFIPRSAGQRIMGQGQ
jgi:hypothetical protein